MFWLLLFLVSANVWADIGSVVDTKGTSCQIERNKQKLSGDKGTSIESMDTYTTGGCIANITFKDDTKVKINENSRLLIDDFVFDPKQSDASKLAIKVGMGTVRYTSGQIAKNNPQQVGIKTPTATIAVRGTDFSMTVDEIGQSLILLVPSCKNEKDVKKYELQENTCAVGKIDVSTLGGTVSLDKAFEATFVASSSAAPTPPVVISIVEGKINSNLIVVKPSEVQNVISESGKTESKETKSMETEVTRRLASNITASISPVQAAENSTSKPFSLIATISQLVKDTSSAIATSPANPPCDPTTSICVIYENATAQVPQGTGNSAIVKGTGTNNVVSVGTPSYSSNTNITIIQNYSTSSVVLGSGGAGSNNVMIIQNQGINKP